MKFNFLDLELTQNKDSTPKIIQIGAVSVCSLTGKIFDHFDRVVYPGEVPDEFITTLTGLTATQVANSISLKQGLEEFWDYVGSSESGREVWTWGRGDMPAVKEASYQLNVSFRKDIQEVDLKKLIIPFKNAKNLPKKGGLSTSLNQFELTFLGRPHNALHDALNTARLFLRLQEIINKSTQPVPVGGKRKNLIEKFDEEVIKKKLLHTKSITEA